MEASKNCAIIDASVIQGIAELPNFRVSKSISSGTAPLYESASSTGCFICQQRKFIAIGHKSSAISEPMAATTVWLTTVEIKVETEQIKKQRREVETSKAAISEKGGYIL